MMAFWKLIPTKGKNMKESEAEFLMDYLESIMIEWLKSC